MNPENAIGIGHMYGKTFHPDAIRIKSLKRFVPLGYF